MTKVLIFGDSGVPSGYGRICDHIGISLHKRGYDVYQASIQYDGLLPPAYEGKPLPYPVASLAEHGDWIQKFVSVARAYMPDVIIAIQDAPYADQIRSANIDWSTTLFMVITGVDGVPLYPGWVDMLKRADGAFTISEFGVKAHRAAGVQSNLCRPGIDPNYFYPVTADVRGAIRQQLGIAPDAFVLGACAQNQGRKCWPQMLQGFFAFAADKPDARFLINSDPVSPAGWDFYALRKQNGWDASKLIFRQDAVRMGVTELRDRYNAMDAHVVLAHREGFGLPLVEAQACGVVSIAMDYCSGTEICGNGNGVLIEPLPFTTVSTWGGALDMHPNVHQYTEKLQWLYDNPDERKAIAKRGLEAARKHTWIDAVDNVINRMEQQLEKRRALPPPMQAPIAA